MSSVIEGWNEVMLSDLGDITTGKTPSTELATNFGGDIPFITPSDMDGRKTISQARRYLTEAGAKSVRAAIVPSGTVIVSCIGSDMGKTALCGRRSVTNQQINSVIIEDQPTAKFVYYNLLARKAELQYMAAGSAQPILNKRDFSKIRVLLPDRESRVSIAHILGTLDEKIEVNRRMNRTLEAIARANFKSWFVDFDPVYAKAESRDPGLPAPLADLFPSRLVNSELGEIPEGWKVKPISELCTLGRGASPRPINDFMNGEVPWVKIADATAAGGPFLFETKERLKTAGVDRSVSVAPGDLILSNSATCGLPMFVELHGCIHDGWLYFKNLNEISKLYLFHVLIELAEHLVHIADGSVQKNLNTNLVGQQTVLVPPKANVDAFDGQVNMWFAKMRLNSLESRALAALRGALLPKLISGDLRIEMAVRRETRKPR